MNTPSSPLNGNWQGNSSLDAWSEPPPNVESESESQKQPEFKELLRIQVVESSKLGGSYLTKHRIYFVKQSNGVVVERRYSNFTALNSIIQRRYPFRLLPILPPKRVSLAGTSYITEAEFIERRKKGLVRYLECLINHPILSKDSVLSAFLSLPTDFAVYLSTTTINLDDESQVRVLAPEELALVPEGKFLTIRKVQIVDDTSSDLETKLGQLRARLILLISHWTSISTNFDKTQKLRIDQSNRLMKMRDSLDAAVEVERAGWRSNGDKVERDELLAADHFSKSADILKSLAESQSNSTGEEIKKHLGIYLSQRDLFLRHAVLSLDPVEKIKKVIEGKMLKIEILRTSTKAGDEAILLSTIASIEIDQNQVESYLIRRTFIRYCLHQELMYLFELSNRFSIVLAEFTTEEQTFAERAVGNWKLMREGL